MLTFLRLTLLVCIAAGAQTRPGESQVRGRPNVPHDKDYLISTLEETLRDYAAAARKANARQWRYKPAPGKWSLAELTEHLLFSEIQLYFEASLALNAPPRRNLRRQVEAMDGKAIDFILEAEAHVASKMVEPIGSEAGMERLLRALEQRRQMSIDLVRGKTEDELRTHFVFKSKLNRIPVRDTYQQFLIFALHVARHMRQVDSIQNDPGYLREQ